MTKDNLDLAITLLKQNSSMFEKQTEVNNQMAEILDTVSSKLDYLESRIADIDSATVSYTHLTLPTKA